MSHVGKNSSSIRFPIRRLRANGSNGEQWLAPIGRVGLCAQRAKEHRQVGLTSTVSRALEASSNDQNSSNVGASRVFTPLHPLSLPHASLSLTLLVLLPPPSLPPCVFPPPPLPLSKQRAPPHSYNFSRTAPLLQWLLDDNDLQDHQTHQGGHAAGGWLNRGCIDALPEFKYGELVTARKGQAKAGG
jgi:hypothetical protein